MSLFRVFDIAATALNAQSVRMNTTASNMANANSASSSSGATYRARNPIFTPLLINEFGMQGTTVGGVKIDGIVESEAPLRREYHPQHPMADQEGYVFLPNVNVIEEMANMISASRSYQTNIEVIEASKRMLQQTLALGQ
ncbi:MAG: flagellar basal body rod protein FlgC [Proteobacteria bacterium]|nr:flagellar basal body rod protein FlgC [Pseudomonadota bacterium]MCZ6893513.1 flagellar basal body rod protein FlgC [Gammaproteobacteria bacterium]